MSEKYFQAAVLKYLKKEKIWHRNIHGNEFQSGLPDIIACVDGTFLGLELKIYPNKPTPQQETTLAQIKKSGGEGCVVYTLDEVKNIVERIRNKSK